MSVIPRFWGYLKTSLKALRRAGRSTSILFACLAAFLPILWAIVAHSVPKAASPYTTAVFLGGLSGLLVVFLFLASSRHLRFLAKTEERARLEKAGIALVFNSHGHLLLHFQSDTTGDTSWPLHWVPPGGLASGDPIDEAGRRLKVQVDEHEWHAANLVATTNDSRHYFDIVRRALQTPVKVHAYWFHWSEAEIFMPDHVPPKRDLHFATADTIPGPMPGYYPELLQYLDALRDGNQTPKHPKCWNLHDCEALAAALRDQNSRQAPH